MISIIALILGIWAIIELKKFKKASTTLFDRLYHEEKIFKSFMTKSMGRLGFTSEDICPDEADEQSLEKDRKAIALYAPFIMECNASIEFNIKDIANDFFKEELNNKDIYLNKYSYISESDIPPGVVCNILKIGDYSRTLVNGRKIKNIYWDSRDNKDWDIPLLIDNHLDNSYINIKTRDKDIGRQFYGNTLASFPLGDFIHETEIILRFFNEKEGYYLTQPDCIFKRFSKDFGDTLNKSNFIYNPDVQLQEEAYSNRKKYLEQSVSNDRVGISLYRNKCLSHKFQHKYCNICIDIRYWRIFN